jgi:hypothetical protein
VADLAEEVRDLITKSRTHSARTIYGETGLGVSDIGHCREYARRLILGLERSDESTSYDLAALVGTAIGREMELAYVAHVNPVARIQAEVVVNFEVTIGGIPYRLNIPGHPDVVDSEADQLIDWKSFSGLGVVRANGFEQQPVFQVSLYADAAIKKGWLTKDCTLALIGLDRSGQDPEPYVQEWTFDPGIVEQAYEWLNDVLYAVANSEEASRDKPRSWCFAVCEYATNCRTDTDVEGLIEDPFVLDAIRVYKESGDIMAKAKKDRESAASVLTHVDGRTEEWTIRHTEIGGGHVEYDRKSYIKLDISPNRPRKAKKDEDSGGPQARQEGPSNGRGIPG